MSANYLSMYYQSYEPTPDEDLFHSLFSQYERVLVHTLITSFGLDFLVADQHGGDVDTIHNVREIGSDPNMYYKKKSNQQAYDNRGAYDPKAYHPQGADTAYAKKKREARNAYRETGETVTDAYTGRQLHFGGGKGNSEHVADLDHVIAAKTIHEDRGRVLSGMSGVDLANDPSNLQFTNAHLNRSMGAMSIPEYIDAHPDLDEETKARMQAEYDRAKAKYDSAISRTYYHSSAFRKDMTKAAAKRGVQMGLRQAIGLVFTEIWFSVKDELHNLPEPFDLGNALCAVGKGIQNGFINAKSKYKDVLCCFKDGATAGALASLTTTLANIFFTTAKNVVKIIRQTYTSLVQAAEVLFINPGNLLFGERMRTVVKIICVGASVVVGGIVSDAVNETPVGKIPAIGDIVSTFAGTMVTGIMSCTLLFMFDRSKMINQIVSVLNKVPSAEKALNYFQRQAEYFEEYAAKVLAIDSEAFQQDSTRFISAVDQITAASSEESLNRVLRSVMEEMNIPSPWGDGSFHSFMQQKDRSLVFE